MEPLTEQDVRNILADVLDDIFNESAPKDKFGIPRKEDPLGRMKSDTDALRAAILAQAEKLRGGDTP